MRIDKWLYYARIYKTRSRSAKACLDGDIMINKLKKNNSSFNVSINDCDLKQLNANMVRRAITIRHDQDITFNNYRRK